jgi:hypothetical protein
MNESDNFESYFAMPITDLPTIANKKSYLITANSLPPIIANKYNSCEIAITKRQLYKSSSMHDDIIIHMSKQSARALGFYILSACFSANENSSSLLLKHQDTEVKKITINKPKSKLNLLPQKYIYHPKNPHEFNLASYMTTESYENTFQVELILVNSNQEFTDNFVNKNNLIISGSYSGLALLS